MYYTTPLHLQPALAYLGYGRGSLPVTEQLALRQLLRAALGGHRRGRAGACRLRRAGCSTGGVVIPVNRHRLWQLLADAALIALAWWLAFWLRFDQGVPGPYHRLMIDTILVVIAIKLAVFIAFGFYNRWWRYVSTRDMWGAARGVTVACVVADLVVYFAHPDPAASRCRARSPCSTG